MAHSLQSIVQTYPRLKLRGNGSIAIRRVVTDSRICRAGDLFIAVRGHTSDGHAHLAQAIASGCAAVMADQDFRDELTVPVLTTGDTRPWPALIARELHGRPDLELTTIGITGTNGKTTTAWLVRNILQAHLGKCGLLGTIVYDDGASVTTAPLTTPAGPRLYGMLAAMRDNNCRGVAMEISSHALDQQRTAGLSLSAAVLTNLSRDHLDYHQDMDSYLQAKLKILDLLGERSGTVVLNAMDPYLTDIDTGSHPVLTYATGGAGADLQVHGLDLGLAGSRIEYQYSGRSFDLQSRLVGRYNVENLTAALAAGLAVDVPLDTCLQALRDAQQVPGRMERIMLPCGAIAVVDYAHTPDALAAVIDSCRELADGRLLTVFGCGGDRDKGKRALMGEVSAGKSDATWITSDNPRSEDPDAIIEMVVDGYRNGGGAAAALQVEVDRRTAIESALAAAGIGDVVIVAGKGHEDYQLIGDQRLDFEDAQVVNHWVRERTGT